MQIGISWICRGCGADQKLAQDTSNFVTLVHSGGDELVLPVVGAGEVTLEVPAGQAISVPGLEPVKLTCASCGHISGDLALVYGFSDEHRPSWER